MLNLKRKATLFANSYHKLQLVGINNITAGGKEQRTIPILIESHFICEYRLVSIALPYNTNSQKFSESVEQRHSNATMPSRTTRSASFAIKTSSGDTLDKSIT